MGNCCGKTSSSDTNFQGQGRPLGATPTNAHHQPRTAAAPAKISPPAAGRTLGNRTQAPSTSLGPGAAAAKAAEERAKASQGKGKLGKQLNAQKAQTQTGTLAQAARDNIAARDADAAAQARNWD